ncbi:RNA 3'-terminal phosphate cyclase, partial [Halobacteriales archaeon QS_5_70_17]
MEQSAERPRRRTGERAAHAPADSPESSLVLAVEFERSRAGFAALGERGEPVGEVAAGIAEGRHLPGRDRGDRRPPRRSAPASLLALAGGRLTAPAATDHVEGQR